MCNMVLRADAAHASPHYHVPSRPVKKDRLKPTHKGLVIWHIIAVVCCYFGDCTKADKMAEGFKLVDLSHVFDDTTIYWVTERPLTLNVTYNGTVPGKDYWYQKEEISAATHGGTHMDAPCHFAAGRWCVSDIPVEHLVAPTAVIDISGHVNGSPGVHLSKEHLMVWEKEHGKIPERSLLLIYTGWSKLWPDRSRYVGTTERNVSLLKFPSIEPDAAKWIVSNRDIVGVGIDTMSLDIPERGTEDTHVILSENNIYGLENVNNLDLLPPRDAVVSALPMKLKGASGAPCRVLAQIPVAVTNSSTNTYSMSLITFSAIFCLMFLQIVNERK